MLKQKQLYRHSPPNSYGDCHRAALACLLDLPVHHVPHFGEQFYSDPDRFQKAFDDWLIEHYKLRQVHIVYQCSLQEVLDSVDIINPGLVYMLCGMSRNNVAHTVIAGRSQILWDPSIDNSGIVGPIEGSFWVSMLVPHYHFPAHDQDSDSLAGGSPSQS